MHTKKDLSTTKAKNNPLQSLFYSVHFDKHGNEERANVFADRMLFNFRNSGLHNITTLCKNIPDGIGDYVSQIYFDLKMQRLFSHENVNLKSISLITQEKLSVATFVREGKLAESAIFTFDPNKEKKDNSENIYNHQNIIIVGQLYLTEPKINPALLDIIQKSDFVFNLAIPLNTTLQRNMCNDRCFIQSWKEYAAQKNQPLDQKVAYAEFSMGFEQDQMGIRILPEIESAANRKLSDEEKLNSLLSLENKNIPNALFDKSQINENIARKFISENSFCFGYIQNITVAQMFVRIAAHTTDQSQNLNAVVNLDYFKDITENLDFINHIKSIGFTHINLINKKGEIISINIGDSSQHPRLLRLIDFREISNNDKLRYYSLSDMLSGSGDTSISEVISAGLVADSRVPLPFIQNIHHKRLFGSIIDEIGNFEKVSSIDCEPLRNYFKQLLDIQRMNPRENNNAKLLTLCEHVKLHKSTIQHAWSAFCHHVKQNRNEEKQFNDLITLYTFHELLRKDKINEFVALAKELERDRFCGETLLHIAIKLQKPIAVKEIISHNLSDINTRHPYYNYSSLDLAKHYGNPEIIDILSNPKEHLALLDVTRSPPLHKAYRDNNVQEIKLLLKDATININEKDYEGYTVFLKAISDNKLEIAQLLVAKGCDTNINTPNDVSPFNAIMNNLNLRPNNNFYDWISLAVTVITRSTSPNEVYYDLKIKLCSAYQNTLNKLLKSPGLFESGYLMLLEKTKTISTNTNDPFRSIINAIENCHDETTFSDLKRMIESEAKKSLSFSPLYKLTTTLTEYIKEFEQKLSPKL